MNDVRLPIKTSRNGDKIAKICVEDVYKIVKRVLTSMEKSYNESVNILNSVYKEYDGYEGHLIIGSGISQPCLNDAFDEEIGNNIAFMKAKLNANIKKHNFLVRIYNAYTDLLDILDLDIYKVDKNILRDLDGLRIYNPEYLNGIEKKLGIKRDEIQEQD